MDFYKDTNGWKVGTGYAPAGQFVLSTSTDKIYVDGLTQLINGAKVTDINKNAGGDKYSDIDEFIGTTADFFVRPSVEGGSLISGTVSEYLNLPVPAIDYSGEIWFVKEGSGGLWSLFGSYKYPKGLYAVNANNEWSLIPANVKLSEDAATIVNITDWLEFVGFAFDIKVGDRLIYDKLQYENQTGLQTNTPPDTDNVNWKLLDLTINNPQIELKAISKQDQPITTGVSGTVILAEITQETNGVIVNNGVITIGKAGFYRLEVQLNLNNGNNTSIETWAEYFDGSAWQLLADSGNIVETSNADAGNTVVATTLNSSAGLQLRLVARVISGTASLDYSILANGIETPSCTFLVYQINPIVKGISIIPNEISEPFVIGQYSNGNYVEIRTDGTVRLKGYATAYKDMLGDIFGRRLASSQGTVDYDYENNAIIFQPNGDINDANDRLGTNSQINHEFKVGLSQEFFPHIHWFQEVDYTDPQNPVLDMTPYTWTIRYRLIRNGQGVNLTTPEWTLLTVVNSVSSNVFDASNADGKEYIAQITKITQRVQVDCGISDTFQFQITRSDSEIGNALVFFLDEHGEVDGFGSDEEISKIN